MVWSLNPVHNQNLKKLMKNHMILHNDNTYLKLHAKMENMKTSMIKLNLSLPQKSSGTAKL